MFRNGLISAMEEVENEIVADPQEAADTAVAVADETAEIQQDSGEIDVTVSQVEDAVQAGDELESIGEVATDAVESGEGMSEETAEMASIAIESIRNRLGFRSQTRLVPATESFGNTNTRLMSTKLVIESIGDTIKKIWQAIKAAFARLWEKVRGFIAKLFNSTAMLQKHVDTLLAKARNLPADHEVAEKMIKSGAKAFSVGGKADFSTVQTIIKNAEMLVATSVKVSAGQKQLAAAAGALANAEFTEANVSKFLSAVNGGADDVKKAASSFGTVNSNLYNIATGPVAGKDGASDYVYGPFVNSKALLIVVTSKDVDGKKVQAAVASFTAAKAEPSKEIEALNKAQVIDVLGQASDLCKKLGEFKKVQSDYEAVSKASASLADTIIKSAGSALKKTDGTDASALGLKALRDEVSNSMKGMQTFAAFGPQVMFSTIKAVADLASASMANIKAKKAA